MINFLNFIFYNKGNTLLTDLYRKPTDSDSFLHFTSAHPPHTFAAVVYSQAIRYRRIINTDCLLELRLCEVYDKFKKFGYPRKMLNDILDKVKNMPRNIQYNKKEAKEAANVYWVSNYNPSLQAVRNFTEKVNNSQQNSQTWKEKLKKSPIVKVVPRRSPNIQDLLFKRRSLAHKIDPGGRVSERCKPPGLTQKGRFCMQCPLMSGKTSINQNDTNFGCHGGNCQSVNIIYVASCKLCFLKKKCVGKLLYIKQV